MGNVDKVILYVSHGKGSLDVVKDSTYIFVIGILPQ